MWWLLPRHRPAQHAACSARFSATPARASRSTCSPPTESPSSGAARHGAAHASYLATVTSTATRAPLRATALANLAAKCTAAANFAARATTRPWRHDNLPNHFHALGC